MPTLEAPIQQNIPPQAGENAALQQMYDQAYSAAGITPQEATQQMPGTPTEGQFDAFPQDGASEQAGPTVEQPSMADRAKERVGAVLRNREFQYRAAKVGYSTLKGMGIVETGRFGSPKRINTEAAKDLYRDPKNSLIKFGAVAAKASVKEGVKYGVKKAVLRPFTRNKRNKQ